MMNKTLRYDQFIHGKFAGDKDSGYQLVARTAELTNEDSTCNDGRKNPSFLESTTTCKR